MERVWQHTRIETADVEALEYRMSDIGHLHLI